MYGRLGVWTITTTAGRLNDWPWLQKAGNVSKYTSSTYQVKQQVVGGCAGGGTSKQIRACLSTWVNVGSL